VVFLFYVVVFNKIKKGSSPKTMDLKILKLSFYFDFMFFCLETKEPKIQDLETPAKILKNFLKSPNSGGKKESPNKKDFCRHSNSGYFLTEFIQNLLTPPFPRSI